ncbi:hypothetical protein [Helicobacter sp. 11S03491-1]|uniref:hypothetical protein n=1 Tax=Helicobacter sp. 11S03491-1 TaxID=1476196 RepID=UPI000BA7479D|nr:hypothetical protein [Helicobacter sp. 11S03491-1]PAF43056.1 hypothetical protein BKH45_03040 [Helicobacter sp. 11S03491-1]
MKKIMLWLLGILAIIFIVAYIVLFTQWGNYLLKPLVQTQLNKYLPFYVQLQDFSLRPTSLNASFETKNNIQAYLQSNFSLFSQNIKGAFNIKTPNLSSSEQIKQTASINSTFEGKIQDFLIHTSSNIGQSQTHIQTRIKKFNVNAIQAEIKDLHIQEILMILGKKPYINGILKLHANFKANQINGFDGDFSTQITQGYLNQSLIQKDFKTTIPKTNFLLDLQAHLKDKIVKNYFSLTSNIGNIATNGTLEIPTWKINNQYRFKFSDISPLGILFKIPIRGEVATNGLIQGDKNLLIIHGNSDIANSTSEYSINLENFHLQKIDFDIKNIATTKFLWMLYQPPYIDGNGNFKGEAYDFNKDFSFNALGDLKAKTNQISIKNDFNINIPNTIFDTRINLALQKGIGKINFELHSPLGKIAIKKANLDIYKPLLDGNYAISIPELKKLKLITNMQLKGVLNLEGDFKYYPNHFFANFVSSSLGGNIKGNINQQKLHIDFDQISAYKILDLFEITGVFDALVDGNLDYDLFIEKGKISAFLKNSKIMPNKLTDTIKKYSGFDLSKQVFDTATFSSEIDQKTLDSKFNLQNRSINIDSQYMKVNLSKHEINSKMKLSLNKDYIYLILNGDLNTPKIVIDASNLIQKQIGKNASDLIKKYAPPKDQEKIKNLLDGFIKGL